MFLLLFLSFFTCIYSGAVPNSQVNALWALYNSTNGLYWSWRPPIQGTIWDFTASNVNPCTSKWQGIACSSCPGSTECDIIAISLVNYNLTGCLPIALGSLTTITALSFAKNSITGTIPSELCDLLKLQSLVLNNNHLKGPIPNSIGSLSVLKTLTLNNNIQITSTIPISLFDISTLTSFIISFTRVSGSIASDIGKLRALQIFELIAAHMIGSIPSEIGELSALQIFEFSRNLFSGSLPESLFTLTGLGTLVFESNHISGVIPSAIGSLSSLTVFIGELNYLTGSIPSEVGLLTNMLQFSIKFNFITGFIPSALGSCSALSYLDISSNHLVGTIPPEVFLATKLVYFSVLSDILTGSLPSTIGQALLITFLSLSTTSMTGSIPNEIGNLISLVSLNCEASKFSGQLPSSISNMHSLALLSLSSNKFSGTIPPEYGKLASLTNLALHFNKLTGVVPSTFSASPILQSFNVEYNLLTGTIPTTLSKLTALGYINLSANKLTGSIPSALIALKILENLYLYDNMLSGTIPSIFGNYSFIVEIYMAENYLTGTVPSNLATGDSMHYLFLEHNCLTGTIPFAFGKFSALLQLDFSFNCISSTIPSSFSKLTLVENIFLDHNRLEGTVPSSLSVLQALELLLLQYNYLSGHLENFMFGNLLATLNTLDVSHNMFSGTLSDSIFHSDFLSTFSASVNCLSGDIPSGICNAVNLESLFIAGIGASSACATHFFLNPRIYLIEYLMKSIPRCIFSMPFLKAFSADGNGVRSQLYEIPDDSNLLNLTLSNNRLFGTIPKSLQSRGFQLLDLSFNFLSGTIEQLHMVDIKFNISEQQANGNFTGLTLKLNSNRLSGFIPGNITHTNFQEINILDGNLFNCKWFDRNIPKEDSDYDRYICGSDSLNDFFLVWAIVTFCCILIVVRVVIIAFRVKSGTITVPGYMQMIIHNLHLSLEFLLRKTSSFDCNTVKGKFDRVIRSFIVFCCLVMGLLVFVNLPLYCLVKLGYSTHTFQYGWYPSFAYMQGDFPLVFFCIFLVCQAYGVFICSRKFRFKLISEGVIPSLKNEPVIQSTWKHSWQERCRVCVLLLFNLVVIGIVNGAYVYAVLNVTVEAAYGLAVLLGMFKLVWNRLMINRLAADNLIWNLGVLVINNLVGPTLATLAVDSSCFYYLIVPEEDVHVTYHYNICDKARSTNQTSCFNPVAVNDKFQPPFIYSYQCGASLLQNYIPTYVVMYTISGIIVPVLEIIALSVVQSWSKESGMQYRLDWIRRNLGWLRPVSRRIVTEKILRFDSTSLLSDIVFIVQDIEYNCVSCVVSLILMMTFGLAYPLLSVLILIQIVSTLLYQQICVHFHSLELENRGMKLGLELWTDKLSNMLYRIWNLFYEQVFYLTVIICAYLSIFTTDIEMSYISAVCWLTLSTFAMIFLGYRREIVSDSSIELSTVRNVIN